jgi:peptide/nickel transport system permease protein
VSDLASAAPARRRERLSVRRPLLLYVLRRVAVGALLVVIVSIIVFAATQVLPGNAAKQVLGRFATPQAVRQLEQEMGLDRSAVAQYWAWLSSMLHGHLGQSLANQQPVSTFIGPRFFNTLVLAACTLVVLVPLSLGLGVYAGIRSGGWLDHSISTVTLGMISLPEFVTGTLLAVVIGVTLGLLPPASLVPPGTDPFTQPRLLVLPVVTLLISLTAYSVRMVRAGIIEVMRSEYVQSARLNGMPERRLIMRHVLRNALGPAVQVMALTIEWLVGGVVVVETVFQYPGIGAGLVTSVSLRDIPVVQAIALIIAAFYITLNIVADVVVVLLNPKLRTAAG